MTVYAAPGTPDSLMAFKPRYEHWIGGEWVKPVKGQYVENVSPVNGKPFTEVARGTAEDIEAALDAAHSRSTLTFRSPPITSVILPRRSEHKRATSPRWTAI